MRYGNELMFYGVALAISIVVLVILLIILARMIWRWAEARRERKRRMKEKYGIEDFHIVFEEDDSMGLAIEEWEAMHELGHL